jgi:hygromycin-B 4-O-kinase
MDSDQLSYPHSNSAPRAGVVSHGQAQNFLVARFGSEVEGVARVGQGEWSIAYAFRRGGDDYVVRFGAHREDFAKDRLAGRYSAPDLPIPPVTEIGEAFGGFYAVAERAFGGYLDDLDGPKVRELLPALFAASDAARRVNLSATAGYGIWDAEGTAPHPSWRAALLDVASDRAGERTHGWRDHLAASPVGTRPFDEAFEYLDSLVDYCPEDRHLVHSDLLNYNVLVADGRISAVIDWGSAMYGDFLYDLAWFAYWTPWYPAWFGVDFRNEAAKHYESIGLQIPYFGERFRCYQIHIGLSGIAYRAFRGDWSEVEIRTKRTLAIAHSRP